MARQVNLYEAKTHLSQLVEDAAKGEEIVIAKNGKPLAKLVVATPAQEKPKKRVGGQWAKYLTPEQIADIGSEDWWRRWKEADAEIGRDFEESVNRPIDQVIEPFDNPPHAGEAPREFKWADTSSTPTPSSTSKTSRTRSAKKRAKPSRTRKTRSS